MTIMHFLFDISHLTCSRLYFLMLLHQHHISHKKQISIDNGMAKARILGFGESNLGLGPKTCLDVIVLIYVVFRLARMPIFSSFLKKDRSERIFAPNPTLHHLQKNVYELIELMDKFSNIYNWRLKTSILTIITPFETCL
ncbi:hypothetical protein ACJX0J_013738, partial [Zea mays]